MKGKTKKILAGVGLGAMMATTALFGGCTAQADVNISQSDVDTLITDAKDFLERENDYTDIINAINGLKESIDSNNKMSRENVKNRLYDLVLTGLVESTNINGIKFTNSHKLINNNNLVVSSAVEIHSVYKDKTEDDKDVIKVLDSYSGNLYDSYCEAIPDYNDALAGELKYNIKVYNQETKTYTENSKYGFDSSYYENSYYEVYTNLLVDVCSEKSLEQVNGEIVKYDKIENVEKFTLRFVFENYETLIEIVFEDGLISERNIAFLSGGSINFANIKIERCEGITFDTTDYTLVTA